MKKIDPDVQLRNVLTTFINNACSDASVEMTQKGWVRVINRHSERMLKAFRAAIKEQVRQLPGRSQKGSLDAAVRSVTPKLQRKLQGR